MPTYMSLFAVSKTISRGFDPTVTVETTVFVELPITETVLAPLLATYMFPFAGS